MVYFESTIPFSFSAVSHTLPGPVISLIKTTTVLLFYKLLSHVISDQLFQQFHMVFRFSTSCPTTHHLHLHRSFSSFFINSTGKRNFLHPAYLSLVRFPSFRRIPLQTVSASSVRLPPPSLFLFIFF